MTIPDVAELAGKRVVSGIGEDLGHVVGIEPDRWGRPRKLVYQEAGLDRPVSVKLEFIRAVRPDRIELKGPREGFHITRMSG